MTERLLFTKVTIFRYPSNRGSEATNLKNTKTITHPERRLALMSTIFGYSIGGSTQKKLEFTEEPRNLTMMASTFDSTNEPTIITEGGNVTEKETQRLMNLLFATEKLVNSGEKAETEGERYAEELFNGNLKFEGANIG